MDTGHSWTFFNAVLGQEQTGARLALAYWSGYSELHWAMNILVLVLCWPLVWLQQVALGQEHIGTYRCLSCAGFLGWLQYVALAQAHTGACLALAFGLATATCTGPGTYRCLSCADLWSGYSKLHWAWNILVLVLCWPLVWLQQVALG